MRLAMLGATGGVGSRILREALDRGHEVTAILRDPSRELPEGVERRLGDPTDASSLAGAVAGHDAVISALGGAREGHADVVVHELERGAFPRARFTVGYA
jgi:putative NADH-flavin reductase